MCLQDIKIAKSKEIRTNSLSGSTGSPTILIKPAANRVYIRFSVATDLVLQASNGLLIWYMGTSPPVSIGELVAAVPVIELWLERHGELVYGPFGVTDTAGVGTGFDTVELLQNVNPESVL